MYTQLRNTGTAYFGERTTLWLSDSLLRDLDRVTDVVRRESSTGEEAAPASACPTPAIAFLGTKRREGARTGAAEHDQAVRAEIISSLKKVSDMMAAPVGQMALQLQTIQERITAPYVQMAWQLQRAHGFALRSAKVALDPNVMVYSLERALKPYADIIRRAAELERYMHQRRPRRSIFNLHERAQRLGADLIAANVERRLYGGSQEDGAT